MRCASCNRAEGVVKTSVGTGTGTYVCKDCAFNTILINIALKEATREDLTKAIRTWKEEV